MFITKMSLPRRRFLQGVGTAFALPFLDAMVPASTALAKTAATARRFGADLRADGRREGQLDAERRPAPASSSRRF